MAGKPPPSVQSTPLLFHLWVVVGKDRMHFALAVISFQTTAVILGGTCADPWYEEMVRVETTLVLLWLLYF